MPFTQSYNDNMYNTVTRHLSFIQSCASNHGPTYVIVLPDRAVFIDELSNAFLCLTYGEHNARSVNIDFQHKLKSNYALWQLH